MNESAQPVATTLVDVTCRHCHRRFGFAHPAPDGLPRCPGCGREHQTDGLVKLLAQLDEFEDQVALSDEIERRIKFGATMSEIALLTGVGPATLRSFVISASPLPTDLYQRACAALGVAP